MILLCNNLLMPVTLTSRPEVRINFDRPDTRRFDYHSGLDTCPIFFFVCIVLFSWRSYMSRSPVQYALANI
jgi:hypothetical protein